MMRVGDLPPEIKKELEQFDNYINCQQSIATALKSDSQKQNNLIRTIPKDIDYLHNRVLATKLALLFDQGQLVELKAHNTELIEDISNIAQLITQLATPGTRLSSSFQLNDFFIKKIKKYHDLLGKYESFVKELETVLSGLEKSCSEGLGNIMNLVDVTMSQYALFMDLCETMARLHSQVTKLVG